jgi:hypothetical protein
VQQLFAATICSPFIALFNPGYLRLTIEDYSKDDVEN